MNGKAMAAVLFLAAAACAGGQWLLFRGDPAYEAELAACLLAGFELRQGPAAPIGRAAVRLFPGLLAALTLVAGVMLLISGVTPATREAEDFLRRHVPLFLVEVSHLRGCACCFWRADCCTGSTPPGGVRSR